jgi:fatty-acyl-CoA synthase/feruloyl-CoA synthase
MDIHGARTRSGHGGPPVLQQNGKEIGMPTLSGTAAQNAQRVPDRAAIVAGGRTWTWSELDRWVGRNAAVFEHCGVTRGDRVALTATSTPEYIAACFGVLRLGAIVVPVNTRLAAPEIGHVLTDCSPRLFVHSASTADAVRSAAADHPAIRVCGFDALSSPDVFSEFTLVAVEEDRADESDDAFIVYTSGTTGRAKGVVVDHHRAIWAAMAQIVSLGLRDGVRYLHLPPLYHSGGVVFLNATTLLGGTNVLIDKFEPGAVLGAIEEFEVTALLGVPTMYHFILEHPELHSFDLSTWRTGVFGAAPMPAPTVEALLAEFPAVEFFQQCGQTEAGPTGIYSTMKQVQAEPNSSGHLAQPFVEARVVDESGRDVGVGEIGELILRGDPIMKGYWNNRAETDKVLRVGWLYTGDLFEVSPTGAMRLVDRRKDVIISGGRNIYSAEVEQALRTNKSILDCAVVGVPHPEWGETVVAMVTAAEGSSPTLDELRKHCATLIADYKLPRRVAFGHIPRNASGKILKHKVRSLLEE